MQILESSLEGRMLDIYIEKMACNTTQAWKLVQWQIISLNVDRSMSWVKKGKKNQRYTIWNLRQH